MSSKIKPIAGLNRTNLAEAVPLSTPFTAFVFPTTFCNFKCAYCGHSLGPEKMAQEYDFQAEHMTMDTFEKVVTQLGEFGKKLKVVSLTGHGEPLLHPRIADMVKLLKQAHVAERIEIITNASLLTPRLADGLIEAGLDSLRISLQGMNAEKYQEVCQYPIKFGELVDNISYFYQKKGNCDLFVKIMDVALDDKSQENLFYETFESICDRMFVEKCRPVYSGVELTKGMDVTMDRYGREHPHRKVCPLCFFMLGIFPNGDTQPCDTIYKPIVLGNIHEKTLLSMWQSEALREFRLMQLNNQRDSNPKCAVCCAPDDVSHPEDQLDDAREEVMKRL